MNEAQETLGQRFDAQFGNRLDGNPMYKMEVKKFIEDECRRSALVERDRCLMILANKKTLSKKLDFSIKKV